MTSFLPSKLAQDLKTQIRFLKTEHPRMTAAEIHRQLLANGSIHIGQVSGSTIERFVRHIRSAEGMAENKDMRRYERPHINEVWYGDTCYGPYLSTPEGKKRVFFIALIDDASRFIVAADVFFNDSFENLMAVLKSAVSRSGRPKLVYKAYAIPQEPRKEANAIYDIFKVQVPYKIPLTTIEV